MKRNATILMLMLILISCRSDIEKPIIQTGNIRFVTSNSAIIEGQILSDGGNYLSKIGFELFQINENDTLISVIDIGDQSSKFIGGLSNLKSSTTYSVRAFGQHNFGTGYGDKKEFTTNSAKAFIDSRDGKIYNEIVIGNQIWLGENLKYNVEGSLSIVDTLDDKAFYGVYYPLETIGKACPAGWHLPTDKEWLQMERFIGMREDDLHQVYNRGIGVVESIMLPNFQLWYDLDYKITNEYGLALTPSGHFSKQKNLNENGDAGTYWSAMSEDSVCWIRKIRGGNYGIKRFADEGQGEYYSIRCIKD